MEPLRPLAPVPALRPSPFKPTGHRPRGYRTTESDLQPSASERRNQWRLVPFMDLSDYFLGNDGSAAQLDVTGSSRCFPPTSPSKGSGCLIRRIRPGLRLIQVLSSLFHMMPDKCLIQKRWSAQTRPRLSFQSRWEWIHPNYQRLRRAPW